MGSTGSSRGFKMAEEVFAQIIDGLIHGLVVGPTNTGKSKLIEGMIRYLLLRGDEPCIALLDPGGATAKSMENLITYLGLEERTLLLDPEESRHYLSYNPLHRIPELPLSLQAKQVAEAILTALELDQKDSVFFMPVLEQVLYHLAYLLIEGGWTFQEASLLLSTEPLAEAFPIIERSREPSVRRFWLGLQELKPRERQQLLGLAQARLLSFTTSELISRMTSQRERALDFKEAIEEGKVLIFNTEAYSNLTPLDSKILSNLLITSIVQACFSREPYTGKDVYIFIEECGEGLIGTEIGKMLRRARKQGLRVILANQDISSLKEENPIVFHQIWANTSHKIVFRDLPNTDLEIIAEEFFLDQLDPHSIKDQIMRTFYEPIESSRTITSYSYGSSSFGAEGGGAASGSGELFIEEGLILPLRQTMSQHESEMSSHHSSEGWGNSEQWSETEVPFYEFKERRELSSRTFYALEELLHLAKQKLKGLRPREICLKKRGEPAQILEVPYIEETPEIPEYKERARERIFKGSGHYATIEEIQREREQRQKELSC
jgi:hypothetical protein